VEKSNVVRHYAHWFTQTVWLNRNTEAPTQYESIWKNQIPYEGFFIWNFASFSLTLSHRVNKET
jgi:hypothetical protein